MKSLPAARAADEFIQLLDRLKPSEAFTDEFKTILEEEWSRRAGENASIVPRLQGQIREQQDLQEKLVAAYLRGDKAVLSVFQRMNDRFEEEIASLQNQLVEADSQKATFEQLLDFSDRWLVDISTAWSMASLDQKQRVQNLLSRAA